MNTKLHIHSESEKAETLSASFFLRDQIFEGLKKKIFLKVGSIWVMQKR